MIVADIFEGNLKCGRVESQQSGGTDDVIIDTSLDPAEHESLDLAIAEYKRDRFSKTLLSDSNVADSEVFQCCVHKKHILFRSDCILVCPIDNTTDSEGKECAEQKLDLPFSSSVCSVAHSEDYLLLLTKCDGLWTMDLHLLESGEKNVFAQILFDGTPPLSVIKICAGRKHFVAIANSVSPPAPVCTRDESAASADLTPTVRHYSTGKMNSSNFIDGPDNDEGTFGHSKLMLSLDEEPGETLQLLDGDAVKLRANRTGVSRKTVENGGIELQEIGSTKSLRGSAGTGKFSFVATEESLRVFGMSQSDDSTSSSSTSKSDCSPSPTKKCTSSSYIVPDCTLETEVWTWGRNEHGQLGHELKDSCDYPPTRISIPSVAPVVSAAAGEYHSAILTAAGEVILFGSNLDGQIKLAEVDFSADPVKSKLGSNSVALDVQCGKNFTVLLVNGVDFRPDIYYWGRDYNSSEETVAPLATRLGFSEKAEKLVYNAFAQSCLSWLVLSLRPMAEPLLQLFQLCFTEVRYCAKVTEILDFFRCLCTKTENTLPDPDQETLENTCKSLEMLLKFHLAFAAMLRAKLLGASESSKILQESGAFLGSEQFAETVHNYLRHFSNAITSGILKELSLDSGADQIFFNFQRLCAENDIELSRPNRAVRQLLRVPLVRLSELIPLMKSILAEGHSNGAKTPHKVKESLKQWQRLEDHIKWVVRYSETTYRFWSANSALTGDLKTKNRLLIGDYRRGESVTAFVVDGYSKSFQRVFLFSDCLVAHHKGVVCSVPIHLVWPIMQCDTKTELTSQMLILVPESDILVTFVDSSKKYEFYRDLTETIRAYLFSTEIGTGTQNQQVQGKRYAEYKFSAKHSMYANCDYVGSWKTGKMHGWGQLTWPDGRVYKGRFKDGKMHGSGGTLRMKSTDAAGHKGEDTIIRGTWTAGHLNGLCVVQYGKLEFYEGYVKDGSGSSQRWQSSFEAQDVRAPKIRHIVYRHGHGVLTRRQSLYVGCWQNDMRHGYGVLENGPREKYLGIWQNDQYHGLGSLVTLEGILYEGTFEKGKFVKGCMLSPDGSVFEGAFDGIGNPYGKGTLTYPGGDVLEGTFYGSFMGQVKVSGGLRRCLDSPKATCQKFFDQRNFTLTPNAFYCETHPVLPADDKWTDLFDHFRSELGVLPGEEAEVDCRKIWEGLSCSMERFKRKPVAERYSPKIHDILLKVPDYKRPFSREYFHEIKTFWKEATNSRHPFSHLLYGVCDVFTSSYSGVSAMAPLLPHSIAEARSLVKRMYNILKLLFPNMPDDESLNLPLIFTPRSNGDGDGSQSQKINVAESPLQFVTDSFISNAYPTLFTLYVMQNTARDQTYWQHISILNNRSDVALLKFMEVKRTFWPKHVKECECYNETERRASEEVLCLYDDAVNSLQEISMEFSPFEKVNAIIRTFERVKQYIDGHGTSSFGLDTLFPIFMIIVVRAKIQHLGSELQIIQDFVPYIKDLGEVGFMFTTLHACFTSILEHPC